MLENSLSWPKLPTNGHENYCSIRVLAIACQENIIILFLFKKKGVKLLKI